jgi:hypothetical protein
MYIWKLREVVAAEGSPAEMIAKAKASQSFSAVGESCDGTSRYANVETSVAPTSRN